MTSTSSLPGTTVAGTSRAVAPPVRFERRAGAPPAPIPFARVARTELRKMFDTRSGFWLMASIAITALLATGAVILFAPDRELTFSTFATAFGFPMAVILPIIALLSVTGEWSQRSGLSTFTIVPHRGRVILAKGLVSVAVGVVSMLVACVIGAVGNLVGTAIAGVDTVWDVSAGDLANIVLANVLGLMLGFMLGVLIRSSAGAIVAYFVYSLVLPSLAGLLAASQGWFHDLQPWVDFNYAQTALFNGALSAAQWEHLAVTAVIWLVVPLAIGVRLVLRSEVQ
jgi:ABC-2 type transport system permease protein